MDTSDIDFIDECGKEWTKRERYAALREENERLTRELDEARVTKDMHKERAQEAWAAVTRLEGLLLDVLDPAASGRDEMAKPSIRELLDETSGPLADRVERVLTLHRDGPEYGDSSGWCTACGDCWPCATVRALEGEG